MKTQKKYQNLFQNTALEGQGKKIIVFLILLYTLVLVSLPSVSSFSNNTLFDGTNYFTTENLTTLGNIYTCYQTFTNDTTCGNIAGQTSGTSINYTIPNFASQSTSLLNISYNETTFSGDVVFYNSTTIPSSCWNYGKIVLSNQCIGKRVMYQCYNGSSLFNLTDMGCCGGGCGLSALFSSLNLQQMIWNITNYSVTRYLQVPDNFILTNSSITINAFKDLNNNFPININVSIGNQRVYTSSSLVLGSSSFLGTNFTASLGNSNTSSNVAGLGDNKLMAFNFSIVGPNATYTLINAKMYIANANSFSANEVVQIFGVNAGNYSLNASDQKGSNSTINSTYQTGNQTVWSFDLLNPPTLQNNTSYWAVFACQGGAGSCAGYCRMGETINTSAGANGLYAIANSGDYSNFAYNRQGGQVVTSISLNLTLAATSQTEVVGGTATFNATTAINNYLETCIILNGLCNVPFIFSFINGTLNYNNLVFDNVGLIENSQIFNSTTYETSTESFAINITYDTNHYQVATATFNYNGTIYNADTSNGGYFTKVLDIVNVNTLMNKSFFWNISLTNSTGTFYFKSNVNSQIIRPIYLVLCNASITTKTINFTFADEENTSNKLSGIFNGIFNYTLGDGGVSKLLTYNTISTGEVDLCITPTNSTFFTTMSVNYNDANSTSYGTRFFVQQRYPLDNVTDTQVLYLLKLTSLTTFIIQVQDNNLLPVSGVTVETYRFFPETNNFSIVQTGLTDINGQTTGQFVINTVNYKFIVKDSNNNILYTSPVQVVIPTTTPYTIILAIGAGIPSPYQPFQPLPQFSQNISFNGNTNQVIYSYVDSSGNFTSTTFSVYIINYSNGNDFYACNLTLTSTSGVSICDLGLTGNRSGSYTATISVNRGGTVFDPVAGITFIIQDFTSILGMFGLLFGFFIILVCAMMFKFNEIAGTWMVVVAIIFDQIFGLVNFGMVFITGAIVVAIIITIIFKQ